MAKSSVSRKTRFAAGIAAVCAVACILYSRAASRVGAAGLVTYAASAASMILAALLLGGICAVLAGTVLRDAWAKGRINRRFLRTRALWLCLEAGLLERMLHVKHFMCGGEESKIRLAHVSARAV